MFAFLNYYSLSPLINAFVSVVACIYVFKANPKSPLNRTFSYFAIMAFIWSFCYFRWQIATTHEEALFWLRGLMVGPICVPGIFLAFTSHLVGTQRFMRWVGPLHVVSLIFLYFNFTSNSFISSLSQKLQFPFWPTAGLAFTWFTIYFFIVIGSIHLLILKEYKRAQGEKKMQLQYVILGTALTFVGGSTNFFLWWDIPIPPVGTICVSLYVVTVAYAIIKYHLMDIRVILKKSLVYTGLITFITIGYIVLIVMVERTFQDVLGYRSIFVSIFSAVMIAFVFVPLKTKIESFINRLFFKGSFLQIAEQNELLQSQVAQAERYKVFANICSGIVHGLRNPLTTLKGYSHFLAAKVNDKEYMEKAAVVFNREIDRMTELIDRLMEYSQPVALGLKETKIVPFLEEILADIKASEGGTQATIMKHLDLSPHMTITIDPLQMKQALKHVLQNAIESGGQVWIDAQRQKDWFEILIKDLGKGIPKNNLGHVFDPFFTTKTGHVGLGLSISQAVVEQHRGEISISSEPEVGTEVSIKLPYK